jgi:hypothetical protein
MDYRKILIANNENSIICNIVYREVEGEIVGAYSGYSGGGVFDMRFFHLNQDLEATATDDSDDISLMDENFVQKDFDNLELERSKFENPQKDGVLSKEGLDFLSDIDSNDGIRIKYTELASEDVIYDIQDEWTLLYCLN